MNFVFRNVRSYIRDISIVIVGIVITFAGSELVSRQVKKKEIRAVMELIKDKFESNIRHMEEVLQVIESERMLYVDLMDNRFDLRRMPLDSLQVRRGLITYVSNFVPKKDAFDLLKSSSLMQYIRNKELMLKIIEVYDRLYGVEIDIRAYYEYKSRAIMETIEGLPLEVYDEIWGGADGYKFYEVFLTNVRSLSFIGTGHDFFSEPLENSLEELYEVIGLLNEEYGFKSEERDRN